MALYHVRIHYRTQNQRARRVTWFRQIEAANAEDAQQRAIKRVVSHRANNGQVEIESAEAREHTS